MPIATAFVMIKRLRHQLTNILSSSTYPILYYDDKKFNVKNVNKFAPLNIPNMKESQ